MAGKCFGNMYKFSWKRFRGLELYTGIGYFHSGDDEEMRSKMRTAALILSLFAITAFAESIVIGEMQVPSTDPFCH